MFNFSMFKFSKWWTKSVIAEQIQAIWDFTAGLTVTRNNIKNVSTAGIQIKNDTAADAVKTIQQSAYNSWKGSSWNTGTSASNTSEWKSENIPVSGATPYGIWTFSHSQNGAAFISRIFLDSRGHVGINETPSGVADAICMISGTSSSGFSMKKTTAPSKKFSFFVRSTGDFGFYDDTNSLYRMNIGTSGGLKIGNGDTPTEILDVSGAIKTVYVSDTDSDTNDVLSTGITAKFGLVLIKETTANKFCLYRIKGDNSIPLIIDGDTEFAAVKDNASTYNFYYESDQFKLQNKVGDNKALYVGLYLV